MKARRFRDNPIICPDMDERMGANINGPSLIRAPAWLSNPLGRYYLYFAHHQGTYVRLAFADRLEGPWRTYTPGVLDLDDSHFNVHIASPDVHVMPERREIWMYYHGCCLPAPPHQATRVAVSTDGVHFVARPEVLGSAYWRVFKWRDHYYALEMPGRLRRSGTGLSAFEQGPTLFTPEMRHSAVQVEANTLNVFYSNAHDRPERILRATIDLRPDWSDWRASQPTTLLSPKKRYEGSDQPLEASRRGAVHRRVRQLRDPCIFEEDGKSYLLYSVAGEHGIAIAKLIGK